MRTTLTDAIQFNSDGTVHSHDGNVLNKGVQNPNALSDSAKAKVNISLRDGSLQTFNTGGGNAQIAPAVTSVQMKARTGLVNVAGQEVTEEVAATLRETAPQLFEAPEVAKAEAKAAAADAAREAADLADLNRFADDAVEGVYMHISNDVEFGDQVRLLHELHTTGTVSTGTINRFADQLHMSVADTIDAVNALHTNTSLQLAAMCKANGVDAQAFSSYMKTYQSGDMFKAIQVHSQERDMVRAWGGHIASFKARGGK
jgi:hypothetical protein